MLTGVEENITRHAAVAKDLEDSNADDEVSTTCILVYCSGGKADNGVVDKWGRGGFPEITGYPKAITDPVGSSSEPGVEVERESADCTSLSFHVVYNC
jgi:hypothetical protein